jgi:hypothetical protein
LTNKNLKGVGEIHRGKRFLIEETKENIEWFVCTVINNACIIPLLRNVSLGPI